MPQKPKVAPEAKIGAVEAYLQGKVSSGEVIREFGVDGATFRGWIVLYQTRGREGLIPQPHNRSYSPELKIQVVQEYQAGRISLLGLCAKYSISDPHIVSKWIQWYNGQKGFKRPNSGGEIYMTKGRTTTQEERIEIVTYCIEQGKDYGAAIERYQVSYQQIYSWVRKYEASGISGLSDKRGKRKRPNEMTDLERLRAENRLLQAENKRKELEIALLKKLQEVERRRG